MVKLITACLLTFVVNHCLCAQDGYRYSTSFENGEILLESGPADQFGNSGGPFLMTIKIKNGKEYQKIIYLHQLAVAIENGTVPKLWYYNRSSGTSGRLNSISLDGKMEAESIEISPGDGWSDIGNAIYKSIFTDDRRLHFKTINNYTIPKKFNDVETEK